MRPDRFPQPGFPTIESIPFPRLKTVLLNGYSRHNIGDALLIENSLAFMETTAPTADPVVLAVDPGSFDPTLYERARVERAPVTPPPRAKDALGYLLSLVSGCRAGPRRFRVMREVDLAFSVGGGFMQMRSLREFLTITAVHVSQVALCRRLGVPVVMLPQSFGPFRGVVSRALAQLLVRWYAMLIVRDQESVDYLEDLPSARDRTIRLAPDLALLSPARPPRPRATEAGRVGLVVRQWWFPGRPDAGDAYRRYLDEFGRIARGLHEDGWEVELLVQSTGPTYRGDDRRAVEVVRKAVGDGVSVRLPSSTLPANQLIDQEYGRYDALVATRLHAGIMGLLAGVPCVAIGYEPKTKGILRYLGIENWAVPIESLSADVVLDKMRAIESFPMDEVKCRLDQHRAELEELARDMPGLVQRSPAAQ